MESLSKPNSPLAFLTPNIAWSVAINPSEDWQTAEAKWTELVKAGNYLDQVGLRMMECKDGFLLVSSVPYCKDIPWDLSPLYADKRTWSEKWEDFWSDQSLMEMLVSAYVTQHKLVLRDFLLAYASIRMYDRGEEMSSYKATVSKLALLSTYIEAAGTYLPPDLDGLDAAEVFSRVKNRARVADRKSDGTWPYRVSPVVIDQSQRNLSDILDYLKQNCEKNFKGETGYKIIPVGNTFNLAKGDLSSIMEVSHV